MIDCNLLHDRFGMFKGIFHHLQYTLAVDKVMALLIKEKAGLFLETITYHHAGPIFEPICLGCLQAFGPDGPEPCPSCQFRICCSEKCDQLDHHLSQECKIFSDTGALSPLKNAGKAHFIFNSVGLLRMAKKLHEAKGTVEEKCVRLLMSHAEER